MEITLTPVQWNSLKVIVDQGKLAEMQLGLPIELVNGDQKIKIEEEEVEITLED